MQYTYTIDHTLIPSDVTDVPLPIDLSEMPASFWANVTASGGDIRVYKADATTEVAREVAIIDTGAETGFVFFLADYVSSSTDTVFVIEIDGTSSDYAVGATYGRNAVWADYVAVLHMNDASGGLTNATGNGDFTEHGSPLYQQSGKLGYSVNFDGSTDYFTGTPTGATTVEPFTLQAWGKLTQANLNQMAITVYNSATQRSWLQADNDGWNAANAYAYDGASGKVAVSANPYGFNTSSFVLAHAVFSSDSARYIYIDGVTRGVNFSSASVASGGSVVVGANPSFSQKWKGNLDEVRIINETLGDKIAVEYASMDSPGTFATLAEAASGPDYTLTAGSAELEIDGQAASIGRSYTLSAGVTGLEITGQEATLSKAYTVSATAAALTITGQTVVTTVSRTLVAGVSELEITPYSAEIDKAYVMSAGTAGLAINGQTVALAVARVLSTGSVELTITPYTADIDKAYVFTAGATALEITPQASNLTASRSLTTGTGALEISPQAASIDRMYIAVVGTASLEIDAKSSSLVAARQLLAGASNLEIINYSADIERMFTLTAGATGIELDAKSAGLYRSAILNAGAGEFVISPYAVMFDVEDGVCTPVYTQKETPYSQKTSPYDNYCL